jgi:hypothetical protein
MKICVFCASSAGSDPALAATARLVGKLLAERGIGLVYGGGNVGLMGVLADAALSRGGEVDGVIPRALVDRELAHGGCTRLHVVDSMHARKQLMHELSSGFITLPGGFGTLDELFETLTWEQLGMHEKPVGLVEVNGCFAPLLAYLDGAVARGLLRPEHRAMLLADDDPVRLLDRMAAWKPPRLHKWIDKGEA